MKKKISYVIVWFIALAVIAGALLMFESNLLWKLQEMNLFLTTPMFFRDQMVVPGGLLSWAGTFLTQLFRWPWLGVLVLCGHETRAKNLLRLLEARGVRSLIVTPLSVAGRSVGFAGFDFVKASCGAFTARVVSAVRRAADGPLRGDEDQAEGPGGPDVPPAVLREAVHRALGQALLRPEAPELPPLQAQTAVRRDPKPAAAVRQKVPYPQDALEAGEFPPVVPEEPAVAAHIEEPVRRLRNGHGLGKGHARMDVIQYGGIIRPLRLPRRPDGRGEGQQEEPCQKQENDSAFDRQIHESLPILRFSTGGHSPSFQRPP